MESFKVLTQQLTDVEVKAYLQKVFGVEIETIKDLGGYVDQNFLVVSADGMRYVLKVHDKNERKATLDLQHKTAQRLNEKIIDIQFPLVQKTLNDEEINQIEDVAGNQYWVRLLSFVSGRLLADCGTPELETLVNVGATLGRTDVALRNFEHPAANRIDMPWDLKNVGYSRGLLQYIQDIDVRRIADYFLVQFDMEVQPLLAVLRKSIVHHDAHRYSVLLQEDADFVSGVIDFGDTLYTTTVFNVAVAIYDAILDRPDRVAAAAAVVRGYHSVFPLTEQEISALYYLIATRLSIYAAIAAHYRIIDPNNKHAQIKQASVHIALKEWIKVNPATAEDQFRKACGMISILPNDEQLGIAVARRQRYFPDSLYTHYEAPLYLNHGSLQYLHDARGQSYLDCVNNVCQWGHCHPTVVRALQQQVARLNTNSRYIYDAMTEYAERLTATMPASLNVCFFVNSGSEANDLALRLAKTFTGQKDVIVIDKAYHGNSDRCTEISPHRVDRPGKPGLPPYVHKTLTPDTFHGPYKGPDAGQRYSNDVLDIIENLKKKGRGISAYIAESLIGTGGQIVLPPGYLKEVYKHVRTNGGICIADEVQVGFGRIGSHIWCFESQEVVPDIVTMGKPIANGHPMAAVVTTSEIAAAFNNGVTYFNTFGGNPVSCAAGMAVLDVLENENLLQNVVDRSEKLFSDLFRLQQKHTCIVDVRGLGLYVGVELVSDLATMQPAAELAKIVVEAMKDRGVLLNTNGYDNNVIKIKPPLIVSDADIDHLINELDSVLSSCV